MSSANQSAQLAPPIARDQLGKVFQELFEAELGPANTRRLRPGLALLRSRLEKLTRTPAVEIETGRWSAMPAVDTVTTDQVLVVLVDNHGAGTCGAAPFFCSELVSMAANLDVLPRPIRNEATAEALHEYRSLTTANQAPAQRQRQYTLLGLLAAMLMSKAQRHSLSQPADGLRVIALIDDVRTRGDKFEGTVYGVQAAIPGPWLGTSTPAGRA